MNPNPRRAADALLAAGVPAAATPEQPNSSSLAAGDDAHHGMGGLYTVVDGVRRPVQRTQPADLQPKHDQSIDQSPEVAQ